MAKRAKAAKTADSKAKVATPEPFYRPFAKIKVAEKKKPTEAPPAKHAPAKHAGAFIKSAAIGGTPTPLPAASIRAASKVPHRAEEPALSPVDADTFALYMAG